MCLAEFKGFAQLCLCRRVRIRNFVFPALVTAFLPRALFGFGVFKMRRVLVRKVPIDSITACLAHAPKKCTQSGNFQFDINSPFQNTVYSKTKDAFPKIQD